MAAAAVVEYLPRDEEAGCLYVGDDTMRDARKLFCDVSTKRAAAAELEDRINDQYAALIPGAVRYDIERSGGGEHDRTEKILDHIDGIKARQREIVENYLSDIELCYAVVARMVDPTEARLLSLKYLSAEEPRWCDVAEAMSYDERWVYRKVKAALSHAQDILNDMDAEQIGS